MVDVNLLPEETCVRIGIAVTLAIALPLAVRYLWPAVASAGMQFNEALEAEARMAAQPKSLVFSLPEDRFIKVALPETSPAVGFTMKALNIRAKTGASVVSITRAGRRYANPGADWCFELNDVVEAIGEPKELASLKDMLGVVASVPDGDGIA
jgi:K+/H+ antiporter YhaU regulatory subunit KhtT